MNFGDYDRDLWIVREDEPGMASLTSRVGLGTWNIPIKNLQSTLKDLDPSSVIQVLSGAKEDNQCSCSNNSLQPRCQQVFTYQQVVNVRAQWHSSINPTKVMADQLRILQPAPLDPNCSPRRKNTKYFLNVNRLPL